MEVTNTIQAASEQCEICLRSSVLKLRNLSHFYTICAANDDFEDVPAWLCSFCWIRVLQCIHFISTARRSKLVLHMKCTTTQPTDLHPYTSHQLPIITFEPTDITILSNDTNACRQIQTITVLFPPVSPEQPLSDEDVKLLETSIKNQSSIKQESDSEFETCKDDLQNDSDFELNKLSCCNNYKKNVSCKKKECKESENYKSNEGILFGSKEEEQIANEYELSWLLHLKSEVKNAKSLGLELVLMTEEEQLQEIVTKKHSTRYKMAKYKCEKCGHISLIERCLRKHKEIHHNLDQQMLNPHECKICQYCFATPRALMLHKSIEHERRWRCNVCQVIITREQWDQHGSNCSPDKKHECEICHKKYKTKAYLYKHKVGAHKPKPRVICDICNKSYKHKVMLESHMRVHTGEKPFECNICGKKYISYSYLCTHKKLKHEPIREEPLEDRYCVECDKHFKNKKSLERHLTLSWMHGDPETFEFECEYCQKKITTQAKKDLHIKIHHLNIRDHPCPHCEKAFPSKYHLHSHVKHLHGKVKRKRERARKYVCDTCGFAFTLSKSLEEHRKAVHEKLRPYKCQVCSATFGFKAALFTHNKLKHGGSKAISDVPSTSTSLSCL